jgi:hypothetical protein
MNPVKLVVLYGFSFVLLSILLQQVLPFPFGLYSGLLVFAMVPIILRKYVRDLVKSYPKPNKS